MKLIIISNVKLVIALLSLILVSNLGELVAQSNSIKAVTNQKFALENLIEGIKSENEGVRRSSIYFAGKYKISEAEESLIDQLEREQNPSSRILIAIVLYKIESKDGLLAVKKLAATDVDQKVRLISTHIYKEFAAKDFSKKLSSDYLF